ncbi:MAG: ATPase, partial [Gammaproteobacteria bacterium]|nr:ATPase [Gammaproteobacteria bacterium]
MIGRRMLAVAEHRLTDEAAVVLLGPRQCGKTTLGLQLAARCPSVYLDLESEADRSKLAESELYLAEHLDRLVVIDEIHRAPGLFPVLRGLI